MLKLRALEATDIDLLFDIENQSELWKYSNTVAPLSRYALKNFIVQAAQADIYQLRQMRLVVYDTEDTQQNALALVDLTDYDIANRRAEVGIVVLPQHRQKGVALRGLQLLENYARKFLDLQLLYAYTHEDNAAAHRLFVRAAFTRSACIANWFVVEKQKQAALLWTKALE